MANIIKYYQLSSFIDIETFYWSRQASTSWSSCPASCILGRQVCLTIPSLMYCQPSQPSYEHEFGTRCHKSCIVPSKFMSHPPPLKEVCGKRDTGPFWAVPSAKPFFTLVLSRRSRWSSHQVVAPLLALALMLHDCPTWDFVWIQIVSHCNKPLRLGVHFRCWQSLICVIPWKQWCKFVIV